MNLENKITQSDIFFMQRALQLAEKGAYTTRPNPMVGCVLVKNQQIVGEGWHRYAGQPHAEIYALQAAGEHAKGATAYVTLEPCSHTGRTGPCADALITAGIEHIVIAMPDPYSQVNGHGIKKLKNAGISVQIGVLEEEARWLNRGYLSVIERQRPWVRVKLAASLDGRTAMASGESKWITGQAARNDVQQWRARAGAILSGSGTILADNPQLNVRLLETEFLPPLRVVLDSKLRCLSKKLTINQDNINTLFFHANNISPPLNLNSSYIEYQVVSLLKNKLNLLSILEILKQKGINEVHVEAGSQLCGELLKQNLIDELILYIAPTILGDQARPLFSGLNFTKMDQQYRLKLFSSKSIGDDQRLIFCR